jgi:hypothetical protein
MAYLHITRWSCYCRLCIYICTGPPLNELFHQTTTAVLVGVGVKYSCRDVIVVRVSDIIDSIYYWNYCCRCPNCFCDRRYLSFYRNWRTSCGLLKIINKFYMIRTKIELISHFTYIYYKDKYSSN